MKRLPACAVVVALLVVGTPGVAGATPPPGACLTPPKPHEPRPDRPWEDKLLDPSQVWGVTRGAGVRVGVVDSGVDSDNPQLRGKVFSGYDFVRDQPGARFDCQPHGTPVASIIAGAVISGTGMHGIAPDARIVPARITENDEIKGGPAVIAAALKYTVDSGAAVVNLSLTVYQDDPALKAAVEYAQSHDVLVVAAAGNQHDQGNLRPYPAAYPGVLGVGSIDIHGARAQDSQSGDYVDLVAPGVDVTGCDPTQGQELWKGTSFATPFVAGTAALVRSAWPKLTASQVADRLVKTASVARGGAGSPDFGAGVVNPYRAVTDTTLGGGEAAKPTPIPAPRPDLVAQRKEGAIAAAGDRARGTAKVLIGVALGGVVVGGLVLAGYRRRWAVTRRFD